MQIQAMCTRLMLPPNSPGIPRGQGRGHDPRPWVSDLAFCALGARRGGARGSCGQGRRFQMSEKYQLLQLEDSEIPN